MNQFELVWIFFSNVQGRNSKSWLCSFSVLLGRFCYFNFFDNCHIVICIRSRKIILQTSESQYYVYVCMCVSGAQVVCTCIIVKPDACFRFLPFILRNLTRESFSILGLELLELDEESDVKFLIDCFKASLDGVLCKNQMKKAAIYKIWSHFRNSSRLTKLDWSNLMS